MNKLPLAAGLPGSRRVDHLLVIKSPVSLTKLERRRAYRRKRYTRLKSFQIQCGPPAVEPRSITSPSSSFTDCDSDSLVSIDSIAATSSNYEFSSTDKRFNFSISCVIIS